MHTAQRSTACTAQFDSPASLPTSCWRSLSRAPPLPRSYKQLKKMTPAQRAKAVPRVVAIGGKAASGAFEFKSPGPVWGARIGCRVC